VCTWGRGIPERPYLLPCRRSAAAALPPRSKKNEKSSDDKKARGITTPPLPTPFLSFLLRWLCALFFRFVFDLFPEMLRQRKVRRSYAHLTPINSYIYTYTPLSFSSLTVRVLLCFLLGSEHAARRAATTQDNRKQRKLTTKNNNYRHHPHHAQTHDNRELKRRRKNRGGDRGGWLNRGWRSWVSIPIPTAC
jgi:hypothetical protein